MNISEKIEKIRLEPEHIRLRYVWGAVCTSMFFITIIWIFSMSSLFQNKNNDLDKKTEQDLNSVAEKIKTIKKDLPSIGNISNGQSETNTTNGNVGTQERAPLPYQPASESETPQAENYKDLQAQ